MLSLINYLRGQVEVELEGAFPERFFNLCSSQGVAFWGLAKVDATRIRARLRLSDYKRIGPFAEKAMCSVSLRRKWGLPILLWHIRKRYVLLAGSFALLASLYILSQYVWEFEVSGNDLVSTQTILKNLEELGVGPGVYGPSIEIDVLKNEMLLRIKELSWLTVNISGSRATVEVKERIKKPDIIPLDTPCNVVSLCDGLITRIDTLAGSPQIKAGETITKGQLLVSGVVESRQVGLRLLHARANVYARVWRDMRAVFPLRVTKKQYTGRLRRRYQMVVAKNRIDFSFSGFNSFATCDKIIRTKSLTLPFGAILPVVFVVEEYREYKPLAAVRDVKEADDTLRASLTRRLGDILGEGDVLKVGFSSKTGNALLTTRLLAECEEQVAKQIPLG